VAAGVTPSTHGGRFRLAYAALAAVLAMGVVAFAMVLASRSAGSGTHATIAGWGSFVPAGTAAEEVHQIADSVAAGYRLPGGSQIVAVNASVPPTVLSNLPVANYAVSYSSAGQTNYTVIPAASSAEFQMCGLGPHCAIATGKPSPDRFRLLRREALELALYTFHYVPSIESVVTFMPPKLGQKPQYVFLFLRQQFQAELGRPLSATLAEATPPAADAIPPAEQATIDGLTQPDLYQFRYTQGPDNGLWVVFDPPPAGAG
jgi:hypothetical protein